MGMVITQEALQICLFEDLAWWWRADENVSAHDHHVVV